jgi:hypothetical protein
MLYVDLRIMSLKIKIINLENFYSTTIKISILFWMIREREDIF